MNEIKKWNFEGASVRTIEIDGEPWWVLADVCSVLEISNNRNIAARLEDDEKGVTLVDTLGGAQNMTIINESGLYSVILRSDKPQAKPFRKWVTSEVLPSIRKTGSYSVRDSYQIEDPIERAKRWIEEERERKQLRQQLMLQEHKVLVADAIAASPDSIHIGELAKLLRQNGVDTGQRRLFKWMRDHEFLCSGKADRNQPTQRAIERGLLEVQEHLLHLEGKEVTKFTPMVTGPGQVFFINWFLKNAKTEEKPAALAAERLAK